MKKKADRGDDRRRQVLEMNLLSDKDESEGARARRRNRRSGCLPFALMVLALLALEVLPGRLG